MRIRSNTAWRRYAFLMGAVATATAAVSGLTACGSDSPDNPDGASHVYQEYVVEATDTGVAAKANLRKGTATGECVRLSGRSALFAGDVEMEYRALMYGEEYTYTAMLPASTQSVDFRLKVSDTRSLVNTARLSYVGALRLVGEEEGKPYTVVEGDMLKADVSGMGVLALSGSVASALPLGSENWSVSINVSGDVIITPALKPGRYVLTLTSSTRIPTQENDAPASGSMLISRSTTRTLVVTAPEEEQ